MNRVPLKDILNNYGELATYVIGNSLIVIFFLTIGVIFLIYAKHARSKMLAQWIGLCFVLCGISRWVFLLCAWFDLYLLSSMLTLVTGLMAIPTTVFLVVEVLNIHKIKSMEELEEEIEKVKQKQNTLLNLKDDGTTPDDAMV